MTPIDISLKTLVVTFNDNTTEAQRQEVLELLANYLDTGKAIFVVETGTEVVEMSDAS